MAAAPAPLPPAPADAGATSPESGGPSALEPSVYPSDPSSPIEAPSDQQGQRQQSRVEFSVVSTDPRMPKAKSEFRRNPEQRLGSDTSPQQLRRMASDRSTGMLNRQTSKKALTVRPGGREKPARS